jgi:hypothetical protein
MTMPEALPSSEAESLERLNAELERARRAIGQRRDVLQHGRALLSALADGRLRFELAHAAWAFSEGEDERPVAEAWITYAVAARALLEDAKKNGASALAKDIDALDDALDDLREAVLLLEPEDYKDALATTPPNVNRWWGERARLDDDTLEIELERALDVLREGRSTTAQSKSAR